MTRSAHRAGLLLGGLAALVLATAGNAAANTYTHVTCSNPDTGQGVAATSLPDGWSHSNVGGADYSSSADCTGSVHGGKGIVIGNGAFNPQGSKGILRFKAPPDTAITGYRWWRVARVYRNEFTHGFAVKVVRNSDNYDDPAAGYSCTAYLGACNNLGDPAAAPFSDTNRAEIGALGADTTSLSVIMFCDGSGGNGQCSNIGLGSAYHRLYGGEIALEDNAGPVIGGALGGTMFADGSSAGERVITVSGTDQGGGLYSAELEIDGTSRGVQAFDPNGGRCADVNPANSDAYEFAHPRPCKLSGSSSFTVDTTQLGEGTHDARVIVRDAAGNQTGSDKRTFVVDNVPAPSPAGSPAIEGSARAGEALRAVAGQWSGQNISYGYQWLRCDADGGACTEIGTGTQQQHLVSQRDVGNRLRVRVTGSNAEGSSSATSEPTPVIAAPSTTENRVPAPEQPSAPAAGGPGADRGAPNGSGASDRARLSAYVGTGRRTTIRARYGRSTRITGRLLDASNQPISGATLQVQAGVRIPGSPFEDVGTVRTDRDGNYTYTLAAGPSRLVRFGYRSHTGDSQFADTTDVVIMVRAGVTLRPQPTRLRNGRSTTFAGTVGRPVPTRGVLVDLQVKLGKKWRTFAVARTQRNGRYSFRYRFRNTYRTTTFKFRARARRDSRYPYLDGYSRIVKVKVRG